MTIRYDLCKCKGFAFIKDEKFIDDISRPLTNFIRVSDLDKQKPNDFFTLIINAEDEMFSDIQFEVDEEEKGSSSKTENQTQDVTNGILLGASKQLDAYSEKKFVINHSKKTSSLIGIHPKQNYDVIDSVARNGVLSIPTVTVDFSIGVLFNKLIKYNNFFLIIIHSALEEDVREGSTPNEFCQPIYEVGKGEITAVFYRFISTYFFAYMGILGESDCDHVYDL